MCNDPRPSRTWNYYLLCRMHWRTDWTLVDGGDVVKLAAIAISRPAFGAKQWSIMGREANSNAYAPLVYLQRPKWIESDEVWQQICESIEIKLPTNFEVK